MWSLRCLVAYRVDSCPGCGPRHIDMSECGIAYLAGLVDLVPDEVYGPRCPPAFPVVGRIEVQVEVME